jgi:hypothetical protein
VVVKRIDPSSTPKRAGKTGKKEKVGHTWVEFGGEYLGFGPETSKGGVSWFFTVPGKVYHSSKSDPYDANDDEAPDHIWDAKKRQDGSLQAGESEGVSCLCATCEEIYDCMRAAADEWNGHPWHLTGFLSPGKNCRHFVTDVLTRCCMEDPQK